jgi:hypothetical protein
MLATLHYILEENSAARGLIGAIKQLELIIIHVYMGQDMVLLFPLSAKICVVDVYCKCYALVYFANVIHRSGALVGL